eukprot:1716169-Rhodomonas_salina.1
MTAAEAPCPGTTTRASVPRGSARTNLCTTDCSQYCLEGSSALVPCQTGAPQYSVAVRRYEVRVGPSAEWANRYA